MIENVMIIGAGAMGVPPAVKLSGLPDVDLRVLADEARVERYRREGIFLNGRRLEFSYITPDEEREFRPQLVMIATKNCTFTGALELLDGRIDKNCIILPLLNGITARDTIAGYFPEACALYGLYLGHASVREGKNITFDGMGRILFGYGENVPVKPELQAVKDLFDRAGIDSEIPGNMLSAMWKKFVLNVGVNQTQAYFRADYGMVQESAEMREFCMKLMCEAAAVAERLNIPGAETMAPDAMEMIMAMPPRTKTSMLQDVEAGRQTELESFAGVICRLGKEEAVPTPLNAEVYAALSK